MGTPELATVSDVETAAAIRDQLDQSQLASTSARVAFALAEGDDPECITYLLDGRRLAAQAVQHRDGAMRMLDATWDRFPSPRLVCLAPKYRALRVFAVSAARSREHRSHRRAASTGSSRSASDDGPSGPRRKPGSSRPLTLALSLLVRGRR